MHLKSEIEHQFGCIVDLCRQLVAVQTEMAELCDRTVLPRECVGDDPEHREFARQMARHDQLEAESDELYRQIDYVVHALCALTTAAPVTRDIYASCCAGLPTDAAIESVVARLLELVPTIDDLCQICGRTDAGYSNILTRYGRRDVCLACAAEYGLPDIDAGRYPWAENKPSNGDPR